MVIISDTSIETFEGLQFFKFFAWLLNFKQQFRVLEVCKQAHVINGNDQQSGAHDKRWVAVLEAHLWGHVRQKNLPCQKKYWLIN